MYPQQALAKFTEEGNKLALNDRIMFLNKEYSKISINDRDIRGIKESWISYEKNKDFYSKVCSGKKVEKRDLEKNEAIGTIYRYIGSLEN